MSLSSSPQNRLLKRVLLRGLHRSLPALVHSLSSPSSFIQFTEQVQHKLLSLLPALPFIQQVFTDQAHTLNASKGTVDRHKTETTTQGVTLIRTSYSLTEPLPNLWDALRCITTFEESAATIRQFTPETVGRWLQVFDFLHSTNPTAAASLQKALETLFLLSASTSDCNYLDRYTNVSLYEHLGFSSALAREFYNVNRTTKPPHFQDHLQNNLRATLALADFVHLIRHINNLIAQSTTTLVRL